MVRRRRFAATLVLLLGCLVPAGVLAANGAPTVAVTPNSAPRGTIVKVTGSGYIPKNTVVLGLQSGRVVQRLFTARADANGNITDLTGSLNYFPLLIPCEIADGTYTIYAASYGASSSSSAPAQATFTVQGSPVGNCAHATGPPTVPGNGNPTPVAAPSHVYYLGFNLAAKPKAIISGHSETVVIDAHWPEVFTGKMQVTYDKRHHVSRKIRTNKQGAVSVHFRVTYRPNKKITVKIQVQLTGTVLGHKESGQQSAHFMLTPATKRH